MENFSLSVCAVVVTFNRSKYLIGLIDFLREIREIKNILILDNHSTDTTYEDLRNRGYINCDQDNKLTRCENIFYYRSGENLGGSYGFSHALEMAMGLDCNYFWLMDDDVLPDHSTLKNLLSSIDERTLICVPNRTDDNYHDNVIVDVDMKSLWKFRNKKICKKVDNTTKEIEYIKDFPFEGPLIAKKLVQTIGLPERNLFIFYDDSDYAYRASKVTKIKFIKNAFMHRQISEASTQKPWRKYYDVRNFVWFDQKHGENIAVRYFRPLLYCIWNVLRCIKNLQFSSIPLIFRAYIDGVLQRMGKTVEPF